MQERLSWLQSGLPHSVDEFVRSELGWTLEELWDRLNAAQVDAVALAIRSFEQGCGFINADQTGVGKGRTVAAMIHFARRRGVVPVFITAKPALYQDMLGRDLPDVGVTDLHPFITNTRSEWTDRAGSRHASNGSKAQLLAQIAVTGKLPDGCDAFFTTYDQLRHDRVKGLKATADESASPAAAGQPRPDGPIAAALRSLAPKALFFLDESHLAAGEDAESGLTLQSLLRAARGAYFTSATFAKRASNLALYAAKLSLPPELPNLLRRGGLSLLRQLCLEMTHSLQFIRRELDMSGVQFEFKTAVADQARLERLQEQFADVLREVLFVADQAARVAGVSARQRARESGARLFRLVRMFSFAVRAACFRRVVVLQVTHEHRAAPRTFPSASCCATRSGLTSWSANCRGLREPRR